MSLNVDIRDNEAGQAEFSDALMGSGGWGKVTVVDGGQVVVAFAEFDGGYQTFGPVPARNLTEDAIAVGDRVWLLVGSDGDAGAALKF